MPPYITLILAGLQAAIAAAPDIEKLVSSAKTFFTGLFSSGLITIDHQNQLHAWVDAQAAAAAAGQVPTAWLVMPDPVPSSSPPPTPPESSPAAKEQATSTGSSSILRSGLGTNAGD